MVKYVGGIKDEKTGMEILLGEVSYNNACAYIEINYTKIWGAIQDIKFDSRTNRCIISTPERVFLYDENRGLLLGD